jgi:hypothetical protein
MSKFDDPDYVGKNHPPRKHRFSRTNQPERHSKARRRKDGCISESGVAEELLKHLKRPVTVTSCGKPTQKPLLTALILKLIKNAAEGPARDQLRFLEFLKKNGLLEVQELQARHEREMREERERLDSSLREWRKFANEAASYGDEATCVAIGGAQLLRQLRQGCSCTCLQGEDAALADEYDAWLLRALELYPESGENEQTSSGAALQASPNSPASGQFKIHKAGPPADDEFYSGQIGNN